MFRSDADMRRADWRLARDGGVTLFHDIAQMDATCTALRGIGYDVTRVSAAAGKQAFIDTITQAFAWEEMMGYPRWSGSLDAFHDTMYGFPINAAECAVLAIEGFDRLAAEDALCVDHPRYTGLSRA